MVEMVIHFWPSEFSLGELLGYVNYATQGNESRNNPWRTNTMNNNVHLLPKNLLFITSAESSRKKVLLWLEQKSVKWTMNLESKFCVTEDLVLDTCAGTIATAKDIFAAS